MIATAAPRAAAPQVSYEDGRSICFFGQQEKRQVNSSEIDGNAEVVAERLSQQRKHDDGPAYNVGHGKNVRLRLWG